MLRLMHNDKINNSSRLIGLAYIGVNPGGWGVATPRFWAGVMGVAGVS